MRRIKIIVEKNSQNIWTWYAVPIEGLAGIGGSFHSKKECLEKASQLFGERAVFVKYKEEL